MRPNRPSRRPPPPKTRPARRSSTGRTGAQAPAGRRGPEAARVDRAAPREPLRARAAEAQRIQKLLAAAGWGSRREIESWIAAGRVTVDGRPAKLGERARPGDRIALDGKVLVVPQDQGAARVLVYHKPVGEIVTRHDPRGRPTVFDRLPALSNSKWIAVGRLDYNTSGLLLLADSGDVAHRLMHPRYGREREYLARVQGEITPETRRRLLAGIALEEGTARMLSIAPEGRAPARGVNRWYRVTLGEGRYREVRRLFEAVGARVSRLIRIRYGSVTLPRDLRPGRWRELTPEQLEALLEPTAAA